MIIRMKTNILIESKIISIKSDVFLSVIYFKSLRLVWLLILIFCLNAVYAQPLSSDGDRTLDLVYSKKILPKVDYRDAVASIEIWTKEVLFEVFSEYSLNNIFVESIDQADENFITEKAGFIILTALEYLTNKEKLRNARPTLLSSDDDGLIGIEYVLIKTVILIH